MHLVAICLKNIWPTLVHIRFDTISSHLSLAHPLSHIVSLFLPFQCVSPALQTPSPLYSPACRLPVTPIKRINAY